MGHNRVQRREAMIPTFPIVIVRETRTPVRVLVVAGVREQADCI